MKTYGFAVFLVVWFGLVFGLFGPMLVSSASDIGVVAGLALVVLFPVGVWFLIKLWSKTSEGRYIINALDEGEEN